MRVHTIPGTFDYINFKVNKIKMVASTPIHQLNIVFRLGCR